MRTLLAMVSGVAVIAGIASASLWRELSAERQLTANLRTELTESQGTAARLSMELSRRSANAPAAAVAPVAGTEITPGPTPQAVTSTFGTAPQSARLSTAERLKDPEYRKAEIQRTRLNLARNYPGMAEALGLSGKEADQILELLAEDQVNSMALARSSSNSADQASQEELTRQRQAQRRQLDESLAATLGPAKHAKWEEYLQTRPARNDAVTMGTRLLEAGVPLDSTQMKSLTAVLIAEQQRQRQDVEAMYRNVNRADPQVLAKTQEAARNRARETERRFLDAVAPSVSAQQLATLRADFEARESSNSATSRAQQRLSELQSRPPGAGL